MAWTKEDRANHCRQIAHLGGQRTAELYPGFHREWGKLGLTALANNQFGGNRKAAWEYVKTIKRARRRRFDRQPLGQGQLREIARTREVVERLAS